MYARVSCDRVELESHPATRAGSVLFVDLHVGDSNDEIDAIEQMLESPNDNNSGFDQLYAALGHVRRVSPVGLGNVSTLVIRWPGRSRDQLVKHSGALETLWANIEAMLTGMRMQVPVGLIQAPVGFEPEIVWGPGNLAPSSKAVSSWSNETELKLLCREVELMALLDNGRGVWEPLDYHYRLPSGRHSGSFVRLADAIRSSRDADVLAWWLLEHASAGLGIVMDTSTVIPVALALRNVMASYELKLGAVSILASYPATSLEFARSVLDASRGGHPVLGLLSVSSTGSVRDGLTTAMANLCSKWALHIFVDKTGTDTFHLDAARGAHHGQVSVWTCQHESSENLPAHCTLCRNSSRARVVQIDPRSFDGLVLPEPQLVTPDIRFAAPSGQFWHLCDNTDAIGFDVQPDESSASNRPHKTPMGVLIDFDRLLQAYGDSSPTLTDEEDVAECVLHELRKSYGPVDPSPLEFVSGAELIVCLSNELKRANGGSANFLRRIASDLAPTARVVDLDLSQDENGQTDDTMDALATSGVICILVLGIVTGTSLQRALTTIQGIRRHRQAGILDIGVVCTHMRPTSQRARDTIVNPFGKDRFMTAYESLIPDAPSPLHFEREFLESFSSDASITSLEYYERRTTYLETSNGKSDDETGASQRIEPFWGLPQEGFADRLRHGSWYGESLSATATLVAVGSAIQSSRYHHASSGHAPEWRQFELPAVFRSYFDSLIVCSVLRWLSPEECWWGRDADRSDRVVEELLEVYAEKPEQTMLLNELLLASALGKVPPPATRKIVDRAREVLGRAQEAWEPGMAGVGGSAVDPGPLELGLAIVGRTALRVS